MNNSIFDFKQLPNDNVKVASDSNSVLRKESTAAILSEILGEFNAEDTTKVAENEDEKAEAALAQAAAEEAAAEEAAEEAADEEPTAEELIAAKELEREASAYYDYGKWLAVEKVAEYLESEGAISEKTAAVIGLHVANLSDRLIKEAAQEAV